MVQGRLDAEVSAATDQRADADQQLGQDGNRVGLRVRRDLRDELAGQSVERLVGWRRRPVSGRWQRDACGLAGRRV